MQEITRDDIAKAEALIRPHIRRTPILSVDAADFGLASHGPTGGTTGALTFKLELMQHAGSFKSRGAFTHLLTRKIPKAGVVAASGGNHGAAVAFAARRLGAPAKIFVPEISSPAKIARIRSYGADLVVGGKLYAEAYAASVRYAEETGALQVHAFDQRETIVGQGTLGMELEAQAPEIDTLLVGVGGGGLIAGIASWYRGKVKVVGVEPELAPTLTKALAAGGPVDAEAGGIAADSLAPKQIGALVYPIARDHVSDVVLVEDDAIRAAQRALWDVIRVVGEPGGSAATAALLSGRYRPKQGERVGIVVSGGNTVAVDFDR